MHSRKYRKEFIGWKVTELLTPIDLKSKSPEAK